MYQVTEDILKEDGPRGLVRGAGMRMAYLFIGGSAFFGIYEKSKTVITDLL
jgi:hypothetical protein